MNARIAAIGTANPPMELTQTMADDIFTRHYGPILKPRTLEILHQIISHPSIQKRTLAAENLDDLLSVKEESPDARVRRFTKWAVSLSREAVLKGLSGARLSPKDIGVLIVNTCTGYLCPGLSTYLSESLDLPAQVPAYDLVGHGCGGAVPNLTLASQALKDLKQGVAVSVSIEICSATFQMGEDMSLIVSNAIFGDGAAAAVLWKEPAGLQMLEVRSRLEPSLREYVRFVHKNGQLHNQLSSKLPEAIRRVVPPLVRDTLSSRGLSAASVAHWAVHPGGDKILEEIRQDLGLSREQLWAAYDVLSEFGNMSSPTVLFELERIMRKGVAAGDYCLLTAFGAGLSAYAALLRG